MARRVPLGLARAGAIGSHFSGNIFIAFVNRHGNRTPALPHAKIWRQRSNRVTSLPPDGGRRTCIAGLSHAKSPSGFPWGLS
ncbi:P1 family peptidase [Mesorhizobium sp. B2-6-2]|nr:P1 family peptidase [Mesorhizobium sp. B2-6-2]